MREIQRLHTRKRQKVLLTACICVALMGAGSMTIGADGIKTQADADAINAQLETDDTIYTDSSYREFMYKPTTADNEHIHCSGQILPERQPIVIGNDRTAGHELTLKHDASPLWGPLMNRSAANIVSEDEESPIKFKNLKALHVLLSGATGALSLHMPITNIWASEGGTVTVDDTVRKLDVDMSPVQPIYMPINNVAAMDNGTIKILSPQVRLLTEGDDTSTAVRAEAYYRTSQKAWVYLGDASHKLDQVTLDYTHGPGGTSEDSHWHSGLVAVAGRSPDSSGRIYVNTKVLDISNMNTGIASQGTIGNNDSDALIKIGSPEDRAERISINHSNNGIMAYLNGTDEVYGDTISITDYSVNGLYSDAEGHIVIGTGSGEGQGLFLEGQGNSYNSGITSWERHHDSAVDATVDVVSGNVSIDHCQYGVRVGETILAGGTARLGLPGSPVNDVQIKNTPIGFYSITAGTIGVNARNLNVSDNVATPVQIEADETYPASMTVHTSGSVGKTDIGFHNNRSYFYGNAFDGEAAAGGKTTINVSNGAYWVVNPNVTKTRNGRELNTFIHNLNVSDGGVVSLGSFRRLRSRGGLYTNTEIGNLSGNGGTFLFRTDLQESAEARTVNGHSDQLTITGNSSGSHDIMIEDYSSGRGTAVGGYVLLIKDRSARPGAVFRGSANLQNGGLFAHPVEITNRPPVPELGYTDVPADGTNWYVHMLNEPSVPVPIPPKPTVNAENNMTFSRSRYGALWIEQETLRQRLGELRDHKQDDGIWARITRGEYTMNGVSGNADYTMYHIGYDKKIGNQKDHKQYIGMAYHHIDTDLNYRRFTDDSDMDADIGTIYYTNLGDKGHYLDIVGKFGRMKGKMKTFGEFPESAKWDSPFYSLSAEYGRKILYDNGWYWEPQAQLTYSHLGSDNYLTSQGTHAHLNNINSPIFRTGFTVGKKNRRNEYYGKVFWHHEFEGAEDAYFHDKNDDRLRDSYDFGSSWVTVGLGGQVSLSKDAYLYGDVEKSFGGDVKKKWQWNIGVRFGF